MKYDLYDWLEEARFWMVVLFWVLVLAGVAWLLFAGDVCYLSSTGAVACDAPAGLK